MYRFERQIARKKIYPSKNTVSSTYNVGFYLIIINFLTARVVGAKQMILQPVFSIFPVLHREDMEEVQVYEDKKPVRTH